MTATLGILAQLGEHLPYKQRVTGSSPVGSTSRHNLMLCRDFLSTEVLTKYMARWLNWLEHSVHTRRVEGSSPPLATTTNVVESLKIQAFHLFFCLK